MVPEPHRGEVAQPQRCQADDDLVLGGTAGDRLSGGSEHDILLGDFGEVAFVDNLPKDIRTIEPTLGGADTMFGNAGDDLMVGGTFDDRMDGDENDDLLFGDQLVIHRRDGILTDPRFQALLGSVIYARTDLTELLMR